MSQTSGRNGQAPSAAAQQLREQVAEDRRELAETIDDLHAKVDIPERVQDKAADAQVAVAGIADRAGRTAGSAARFVRWAGTTAVSPVWNKTPQPVRTQVERAGGLVQGNLRVLLPSAAAIVAALMVLVRKIGRAHV